MSVQVQNEVVSSNRRGGVMPAIAASVALMLACVAAAMAPAGLHAAGAAQSSTARWTPVKSIDFSAKHNVMIRSDDGTLTPMDVPYYKATLIAPGTWQIESDGDYHYLLEGDNEALAIDTGYGAGNVREYLQTLTKKPVRYVANTHDHFDHTANNAYFDKAFMSEETAKKATIPFASFAGIDFPRDYPKEIVSDGYKIQLGNREVEVFLIPNHTAGGTAYLDRKSRILFSGDEFMGANMRMNVSVAQLAQNMRKLAARRSEFDRMAGGPGIFDASLVDKYLANAEYILAGHEGEPATQQGRPPGAAAASGQVVYQRRRVRAGDGGAGAEMARAVDNMRRMNYEGCAITYSLDRIRD